MEVKKTVSLTGHFKGFTGLVMNSEPFADMPEELQTILSEEAVAAGEYMTELMLSSEQDWKAKLEATEVTYADEHIRVTLLVDALPEAAGKILRVAVEWFSIAFLLYAAYLSFVMMGKGATRPSPVLRIPFSWVYLAPLVGFSLMALSACRRLFGLTETLDDSDTGSEVIIFGFMGDVSIGRLFLAGIVPGFVLCVLMMATVGTLARPSDCSPPSIVRCRGAIAAGPSVARCALREGHPSEEAMARVRRAWRRASVRARCLDPRS